MCFGYYYFFLYLHKTNQRDSVMFPSYLVILKYTQIYTHKHQPLYQTPPQIHPGLYFIHTECFCVSLASFVSPDEAVSNRSQA